MKTFIYNWEVKQKSPKVIIIAHSLDSKDKYIPLIIDDFKPFCYTEHWKSKYVNFQDVERVTLRSSTNINEESEYDCMYFEDYEDMPKWNCYMSDINLITMFLSKRRFPFTGWFETDPRLRPLEEVAPTHPKVGCFDIECISSIGRGMPKAYRRGDRVEMISILFSRYPKDEYKKYLLYVGSKDEINIEDCSCISCEEEWELLQEFGRVMREEDPDVITGYNIFGFDFDYILKRCKLRLKPLPDISRNGGNIDSFPVEWTSSAYGENYYNRIEASGRVFIDMMLFFQRKNMGSYSLDFVSRKFLDEGKKDVSHEKVWRNRNLIQEYAVYCVHDSELTMRLFNMFYMWTDVCEMSRAMMCSIEDIYTRGEQMKVLNQVVFSCISRGIVLKKIEGCKWGELKGAYVFEPRKGLYDKCVVVDFQSMYPSIMISHNICPSTYMGKGKFTKSRKGILPNIAEKLLEERKKVKGEMKNSEGIIKQILHSRQYSLKVSANSLYGVLGFENNKYLGHYECSSTITGIGREMLTGVASFLRDEGLEVIYGDTDSCVIHFEEELSKSECVEIASKMCEKVNTLLPKPMLLNFEEYYDRMIFFSKKRYVMFKEGDVSFKGVATVRSNYCPYVKGCYKGIIDIIGKNADKRSIEGYVIDSVTKLLEGKVLVDDLVLTKSVKPLERYKTETSPQYLMARRLMLEGHDWQSKLEYIFIANGERLQGNKMYTLDEVEKNDLPVDYKYYSEKQLIPAIKDLLIVTGLEDFCKEVSKVLIPHY
jgi:DNA polymerase elongation subunit (family B)